jgi:Domain of unknown function (DUF5615)
LRKALSEGGRDNLGKGAHESAADSECSPRTAGARTARTRLARLKIKFLADENLRRAIVLGVRRREPSVSFVQAFEAGIAGKDDLAVLRIAADDGRILVSHDGRTMPRHFRAFVGRQASPGLVLIPQTLALGRAIDDLVLLWLASEDKEWINQIC